MVMKPQPDGISRKRRDEPKLDPETGKPNKAQEYTIYLQRAKGQPRVEIGHTQRMTGDKWVPVLTGTTEWPEPFKNHNDATAWMREQYLAQHPDSDPAPAPEVSTEPDPSMVATGDTEPEQPEVVLGPDTGPGGVEVNVEVEPLAPEPEVQVEAPAAPAPHPDGGSFAETESVRVIPDVPEASPWPEVGQVGVEIPVAPPQSQNLPDDAEWMTTPPPVAPVAADPFDPFTPVPGEGEAPQG